jgi:hypothetical protein
MNLMNRTPHSPYSVMSYLFQPDAFLIYYTALKERIQVRAAFIPNVGIVYPLDKINIKLYYTNNFVMQRKL